MNLNDGVAEPLTQAPCRPLLRLAAGRFGSLRVFVLMAMGVSLLLRLALFAGSAMQADLRPLAVLRTFAVGTVLDAATMTCAVLPATLALLLAPESLLRRRAVRGLNTFTYFIVTFLLFFDVAAEWCFWQEFKNRLDFIAVDYLVYTQELVGNAMESYPVTPVLVVLAVLAAGVTWATARIAGRFRSPAASVPAFGARLRQAASLLVAALLLAPAAYFGWWDGASENRYSAEVAKNGMLNMVRAFYENVIEYDHYYLCRDADDSLRRLREMVKSDGERFTDPCSISIRRTVTCPAPPVRKNVVLVVVESLSAEYLGAFGSRRGLTPNLDALAGKSLLFTRMYAAGTRTVRGLESLVLSIPPTPGQSVIKRPDTPPMFNLGAVLRQQGYRTQWVYGGYGYFDNMNAFFARQGFEVVDRANLAPGEETFGNAWGACDGDLFNRVLAECDKAHAAGTPLFSVVMTTSNHRPYTYPQKIDIPSHTGRPGAVKYTDYAIGQFVEKAAAREWFRDTVFVIVADHCADSAGKIGLPVQKYHIPMLVYSPGFVSPGRCEALCSQMDFAPTLLALLKMSYTSEFYGKDALAASPGRALIATYQKLGLLTEHSLVVLEPAQRAKAYRVGTDEDVAPAAVDQGLLRDCIAYYQTASYMLKHLRPARVPQ